MEGLKRTQVVLSRGYIRTGSVRGMQLVHGPSESKYSKVLRRSLRRIENNATFMWLSGVPRTSSGQSGII